MLTTEHINSLWRLARERSPEGAVLRRRIAAIGAGTLGLFGFMLAIGLGIVVLVALALVVAVIAVASLVAVWPKLQPLGGIGVTHVRDGARATREQLQPLRRAFRRAASRAVVETRGLGGKVGRLAKTTSTQFALRAAQPDPRREAIRLNATGTQQRRDGRYEDAVDCHRQALELLRELGDRRGVALTQSNLALALSHAGDDEWAVGLLEEAAATLRELGDEEREAQIMANLGVTHRRHGRREEADNVLELALSKLSPASSAYHAIEELRRAS